MTLRKCVRTRLVHAPVGKCNVCKFNISTSLSLAENHLESPSIFRNRAVLGRPNSECASHPSCLQTQMFWRKQTRRRHMSLQNSNHKLTVVCHRVRNQLEEEAKQVDKHDQQLQIWSRFQGLMPKWFQQTLQVSRPLSLHPCFQNFAVCLRCETIASTPGHGHGQGSGAQRSVVPEVILLYTRVLCTNPWNLGSRIGAIVSCEKKYC